MTSEQHAQRIRQLELQLHIADYGMGMPRDYERVLQLRVMLEEARKQALAVCACDCCLNAEAARHD